MRAAGVACAGSPHRPCCGPALPGPRRLPLQPPPAGALLLPLLPAAGRRVSCAAAKSRAATKGRRRSSGGGGGGRQAPGGGGRRGFGAAGGPAKRQDWEKELDPHYRVYYKSGFKPPRYIGPIELTKFDDGSVGVVASEETCGAELLAVSHPLAFLEGGLGTPPSVEDLHVAMLEASLSPAVNKVLGYLPRKPAASAAAGAAAAAAAAGAAPSAVPLDAPQAEGAVAGGGEGAAGAASGGGAGAGGQQAEAEASPAVAAAAVAVGLPDPSAPEVPPSLAHLMPTFWDQVGSFVVAKLSSRQLMRTLQASSWSEEFQDPAASQVRHERPCGFIGVWPELSLMRHSCLPNASAVVVDKYLLLHATADLAAGEELTFNKLGSAIVAPLAERQAAHLELFGRPCRCQRCQLEGGLPQEAAEQLRLVHERAAGEWQDRLQAALEGAAEADPEATAEALADLQAEVAEEVEALEEALSAPLPDRSDALAVSCAAYGAFDLAWQMEELLAEEPDLEKLASCVALQRLFARGSEGHLYTALVMDQAYTQRAQALSSAAANMKRKSQAKQRALTGRIQQLIAGAQASAYAYAEALGCRYGRLGGSSPQEGLIPQLEQGLTLFYAGLNALSAARGGGGGGADSAGSPPEMTRSLVVDGIPVTVVDTVEGGEAAGGGGGGRRRVRLEVVEAEAEAEAPAGGGGASLAAQVADGALAEGLGIDLGALRLFEQEEEAAAAS